MSRWFFILVIIYLWGCYGNEPVKTDLEGTSMPAFNLLLTDGKTNFNTSTIVPGKPVMLFYFSTHCPFCRAQIKQIKKSMTELKNMRFILATNTTLPELSGFYKEYQLGKYQNMIVGIDTAYFISKYFKTTKVPYTVFYNSKKRFEHAYLGMLYYNQIKSESQ
jgi:thiol-disulfide isomerase/thioredoxin